jgi:DNA-directed RNA polymerase specialized sigma24 family protein
MTDHNISEQQAAEDARILEEFLHRYPEHRVGLEAEREALANGEPAHEDPDITGQRSAAADALARWYQAPATRMRRIRATIPADPAGIRLWADEHRSWATLVIGLAVTSCDSEDVRQHLAQFFLNARPSAVEAGERLTALSSTELQRAGGQALGYIALQRQQVDDDASEVLDIEMLIQAVIAYESTLREGRRRKRQHRMGMAAARALGHLVDEDDAPRAFKPLHDAVVQAIRRRRVSMTPALREDISQAIWTTLLERWNHLDPAEMVTRALDGQFDIVVRAVVDDVIRTLGYERAKVDVDAQGRAARLDRDAEAVSKDAKDALDARAIISALVDKVLIEHPERLRDFNVLFDRLRGRKVQELAQRDGVSGRTIKNQAVRALDALRKQLDQPKQQ